MAILCQPRVAPSAPSRSLRSFHFSRTPKRPSSLRPVMAVLRSSAHSSKSLLEMEGGGRPSLMTASHTRSVREDSWYSATSLNRTVALKPTGGRSKMRTSSPGGRSPIPSSSPSNRTLARVQPAFHAFGPLKGQEYCPGETRTLARGKVLQNGRKNCLCSKVVVGRRMHSTLSPSSSSTSRTSSRHSLVGAIGLYTKSPPPSTFSKVILTFTLVFRPRPIPWRCSKTHTLPFTTSARNVARAKKGTARKMGGTPRQYSLERGDPVFPVT
mmetsp:Transcript_14113/g.29615  ORF Transcript_14113/g.29615 Transcript_14113/m.29615 type:complete len:269 (-) Transcript_14113:276-1082(-)